MLLILTNGPDAAPRLLVDGARDQVLAHAALPAQQHGRVGRGHSLHRGQHLLHLGAARHDVGMLISLAQRFTQRAVLLPQALHIQFFVHHHTHFDQGKRLQDIVTGAGFHGLDRGLHRPERGHHHHGSAA